MLILITDLDGTLLDSDYSFREALPALAEAKSRKIPIVLCTSKTRAETEYYRVLLGNKHPFIVENGGALYIPERHFPIHINSTLHRDEYAVIEIGSPYADIVHSLQQAAAESGCTVRGFHQLAAEEISELCNMPLAAAQRAKQREYDEPFQILDGNSDLLFEAIQKRKNRWTRGGRFYHLLGVNDKAHCVALLRHFYEKFYESVVVVGLGDGLNDAGFLNAVDVPLLMESKEIKELKKAVPHGRLCQSGPLGWNTAVLDAIRTYLCASENRPTLEPEGGVS
jgi:mannosyl-3-phosphoglycerate phosphatase